MRFFYALVLFILTTFTLFWVYVLAIPIPRLEIAEESRINSIASTDATISNASLKAALTLLKTDKDTTVYVFEPKLEQKKYSAALLYVLMAFGIILFIVIFLHWRNYVLFPMITSTVLVLVFVMSLWLFPNFIDKKVYLDLQNARESFEGLKSLRFIGTLTFLELFVLVFGIWYKIPE